MKKQGNSNLMKLQEIKSQVLETLTKEEVKVFGNLTKKSTWESALKSLQTTEAETTPTTEIHTLIIASESPTTQSESFTRTEYIKEITPTLQPQIDHIQSENKSKEEIQNSYNNPSIVFLLSLLIITTLFKEIWLGLAPLFKILFNNLNSKIKIDIKIPIPKFRLPHQQFNKLIYSII